MPPLLRNDIVVGASYFRICRSTGTRSRIARCVGFMDEIGGSFVRFDAGSGSIIADNIAYYDIYAADDGLSIAAAAHSGDLHEGVDLVLAGDVDAISHEAFADGDECVRIMHVGGNVVMPNSALKCVVYHTDTLQSWFDTGSNEEPRTRFLVTQAHLARFRYRA